MATYYAILTNAGQAKIANALALNQTVSLRDMSVGDGNGNPTTPGANQTALVRERYRAQINQINLDPNNPNYLYCDLVIPTEVGGFTVHEAGIFTNDGVLFAVANYPATYKPILAEGSGKELIVRIYIEVTNVSTVELKIDPTVVLASRQWVIENFTLAKQLPGGLTNQILAKNSNAPGDFKWINLADGVSVYVETLEEHQTLADGQTIVDLANLTTDGLAVYIEGGREFDFVALSATQIQLGQSYPGGTLIDFVQNDPTAETADIDQRVNRTIQDAGITLNPVDPAQLTAAVISLLNSALPAGITVPYAVGAPPSGWLLCNGQAVSRSTYSRLFTAIGTTYGVGDGVNTFNIPDLRGRTVIALDGGAGIVQNLPTSAGSANANTLGGKGGAQMHELINNEMPQHSHGIPVTTGYTSSGSNVTRAGNGLNGTASTNNAGGGLAHNNMQPWIALNYIIKA